MRDSGLNFTGTEGDLKIWNTKSFGNVEDNILRAPAEIEARSRLPIPASYQRIPASTLDVSVQDMAHLYAAYDSSVSHWVGTQH
jgi:hypothetical protein